MLDAELALHEPLDIMLRALKTERAYGLDRKRTSGGYCFWFVARPIRNWRESQFLEAYDEYIRIMANPSSYALDEQTLDQYIMEIGVDYSAFTSSSRGRGHRFVHCEC